MNLPAVIEKPRRPGRLEVTFNGERVCLDPLDPKFDEKNIAMVALLKRMAEAAEAKP